MSYLVIVDRYSNWPIIERNTDGADGLVASLRRTFVTYGIPDELSSDGGPQFTSTKTQTFLKNWGVHHRLLSVAFPHSNCRAEIGVKTVKRMMTDNTGPKGEIDTDSFQRAMLKYRNCPDPTTTLSPAMCIFGRPIKNFIPIHPGRYQPHPTWQDTMKALEEALRNRHMKAAERWLEHTRCLPPLKVGDTVRVQNQTGLYPNKWDKTGMVIEVRQFDQYVVKVDGSGRVTLRNRKFLRRYTQVQSQQPTVTINQDTQLQLAQPCVSAPVTSPRPKLASSNTEDEKPELISTPPVVSPETHVTTDLRTDDDTVLSRSGDLPTTPTLQTNNSPSSLPHSWTPTMTLETCAPMVESQMQPYYTTRSGCHVKPLCRYQPGL